MVIKDEYRNNKRLRKLIEQSGLSQPAALARMNVGQIKPLSLRTFKSWLAREDAATRAPCPDSAIEIAEKTLGKEA